GLEIGTAEAFILGTGEADMLHGFLEGIEDQVVEFRLHLPDTRAYVRSRRQSSADLVLAESDVPALVFDHPLQHLARDRVGVLCVAIEHCELQRFKDHVLRENSRLPILPGHQLEQAALEQQQAATGATVYFGLRVVHAEIAQAAQKNLEVTPLVRRL